MLRTDRDKLRRNGKVEDPAAGHSELMVDRLELGLELGLRSRIVEAALDKEQLAREIGPMALVERMAREVLNAVSGPLADPFVGIALAAHRKPDDRKIRGKDPIHVQIINGREQLAPRQISRGA